MTCRDVSGLLPLFFDGELEPRQMRAVALHSSRCPGCETELRRIERVQDLVAATINTQVDEIDLSEVWPAVAARMGTMRAPWLRRLRIRWEEREAVVWRLPAFGLAAATAALALVIWFGRPTNSPPQLAETAPAPVVDNTAMIDSVDSSADAVAVLNEPETNTTVLWVNDESDYGPGGFPQ
jgi:anti-sigma factor RsiW